MTPGNKKVLGVVAILALVFWLAKKKGTVASNGGSAAPGASGGSSASKGGGLIGGLLSIDNKILGGVARADAKVLRWTYCNTVGVVASLFGGGCSSSAPPAAYATPANNDANYQAALAARQDALVTAAQQIAKAVQNGDHAAEAAWTAQRDCLESSAIACIPPGAQLKNAAGQLFTPADHVLTIQRPR